MTKNNKLIFPLFVVFPFAALIFAIKTYKYKSSKIITFFFLVLFGLTFVLGNKELDSYAYAQEFYRTSELTIKEFLKSFSGLYTSINTVDFARHFINLVISRFSSDYRLLFGAYAAIFGYFYLKSINRFYNVYLTRRNINSYFFLLFFVVAVNPIFNINGFRFWTALWIFFYGAYHVVANNNKKHLFTCFFSMLFHFSFIFPIIVIIIYLLVGKKNFLYLLFFIFSFFFSEVILNIIPDISNYIGGGIAHKINAYTSENRFNFVQESMQNAVENNKWYIYLPGRLVFYYLVITFLFLNKKYKNIQSEAQKNLYSFTLLLLSFVNMVSFIPSMGRFKTLFFAFSVSFIFLMFSSLNKKRINWFTIIGIAPFLLNTIVFIRIGLDNLNPWLFTLLPFPFFFDDLSAYQLLFN